MSYEGYYQVICENKHYSTIDCYEFSHSRSVCDHCGSKFVKVNAVDTTNGDSAGFDSDMEKGIIRTATVKHVSEVEELATKIKELEEKNAKLVGLILSNKDGFSKIADNVSTWTTRESRHYANNCLQVLELKLGMINKKKK